MTETQNQTPKTQPRIVPLIKVPEATGYDWLLISTLRQWVFYSKPRYSASGHTIPGNGFDVCLLRVGRKLLVNLDRFEEWLHSHHEQKFMSQG